MTRPARMTPSNETMRGFNSRYVTELLTTIKQVGLLDNHKYATCMIFSSVSSFSVATVLAIGTVAIPQMILYGAVTDISISSLFIASVLPSFLGRNGPDGAQFCLGHRLTQPGAGRYVRRAVHLHRGNSHLHKAGFADRLLGVSQHQPAGSPAISHRGQTHFNHAAHNPCWCGGVQLFGDGDDYPARRGEFVRYQGGRTLRHYQTESSANRFPLSCWMIIKNRLTGYILLVYVYVHVRMMRVEYV